MFNELVWLEALCLGVLASLEGCSISDSRKTTSDVTCREAAQVACCSMHHLVQVPAMAKRVRHGRTVDGMVSSGHWRCHPLGAGALQLLACSA
jgi:hypothetical protein